MTCGSFVLWSLSENLFWLHTDPEVLDVDPNGAAAPYAAPELLCSLQMQFKGANSQAPGILINGP